MKRFVIACFALSLLFAVPFAHSSSTPRIHGSDILINTTVNGTATVYAGFATDQIAETYGVFALAWEAASPTGNGSVNIDIEVWNTVTGEWNTPKNADGTSIGAVVTDSYAIFSAESGFIFPLEIPLNEEFRLKITGAATNPTDTVVNLRLLRQ